MSKVDKALEFFTAGNSCSQAVFAAFSEDYEVDRETAFKIASGFGGGMHLGSMCGAITGAFMVLGLKYGQAKVKPYDKTAEFVEKFCELNGSLQCLDLMGVDVRTEDGLEKAKSEGLFNSICAELIKDAVEILEEMDV